MVYHVSHRGRLCVTVTYFIVQKVTRDGHGLKSSVLQPSTMPARVHSLTYAGICQASDLANTWMTAWTWEEAGTQGVSCLLCTSGYLNSAARCILLSNNLAGMAVCLIYKEVVAHMAVCSGLIRAADLRVPLTQFL